MQQRGFTLIELIIVIVILGILAVTAAPRFIDFQEDARASTLQGLRGALQSGAQLVYAKSAIEGSQGTASTTVSVNGTNVTINYGYPDADTMLLTGTPTISSWTDITDDDWDAVVTTDGDQTSTPNVAGVITFYPEGTNDSACAVTYTEALDGGVSVCRYQRFRLLIQLKQNGLNMTVKVANNTGGFSLVELITVITLIGILAVVAGARLQTRQGYSEYAYQDRLVSALRNMQTRAMQDTRDGFAFR